MTALCMAAALSAISATHGGGVWEGGNLTRIAFAGNGGIWTMRLDTTGRTQVTFGPDANPSFNSDGTRIAFTTWDPNTRTIDIYAMNADGTDQIRLTNMGDADDPEWSPDGSRIAFFHGSGGTASFDIYTMNPTGGNVTRITRFDRAEIEPSWSGDSNRIAFTHDGDIYVINADGTGETRLTSDPSNDREPAFSPDGTLISFSSDRSGTTQIWIMNSDGSNQHRLTFGPIGHQSTFTRDGEKIIFQGDGSNLHMMNVDGSELTRMTFGEGESEPDVGPVAAEILVDSLAVLRGLVIAGGLQEILVSDDMYLFVRPWFVLTTQESPVQVRVEGVSPFENITDLRFVLEAGISIPNIGQSIDLFNFQTNQWEQMDTRPGTLGDSVVEVTVSLDPSRFVQPGTGTVRALLRWKESGPILIYPWHARIDQAIWYVLR
ncbi:MAG: PD40 domain-containing protein [Armatimonadetes bacterium]|nr:PD40 domain-containing protein [Armatimonadota bacterium]